MDFSGKHVFVSGGTSGINLGIANGFAAAGAKLAVMSRSQDKVDAAVKQLQAHGGEVLGFAADVRDHEAVEQVLAAAAGQLGPIDVLISGAAGNFPAPALGISPNGFRSVVEIDLLGTFHVIRAAHAHLRKPGASVINISAPQAYNPMEMQAHVCAAKAGVDMITRVLAIEWGVDGIRVNSISPGPIDNTEGMRRLAPTEEVREAVLESVPLRRMGDVADIANAAMMLSSPLGSYITGVVLPVDGGWSLGGTAIAGDSLKRIMLGKKKPG